MQGAEAQGVEVEAKVKKAQEVQEVKANVLEVEWESWMED